ncbi:MAG: hypothetical protein LUE14_11820 [Clostridiales bacterium]|nr:hypothetical protein [Clostridiales bacterium]
MFSHFDLQTKQILTGNVLLIFCCAFYLAWWILAFKPTGAIKGMRSGWLLLPAVIFGVAAILQIVRGSSAAGRQSVLFSQTAVLIGGVIVYIVLLVATRLLLNRQVTTELFLIVGWTVLMFLEMNALFAQGQYSRTAAIVMLVVTVIAAAVSLVCYLLYYNLDSMRGYVDGMVPLLFIGVMMVVVTSSVMRS